MTAEQRLRYEAALILAVAASNFPMTLAQASDDLGIDSREPAALARKMLSRSIDAGTWREQRAEAEAKLRHWRGGW